MKYDKYLNRIQKLNKLVNALYRLRFVLASVASVTLVGVLTFEFTKGIVKVENFNQLTYVYGDKITALSSAFANDSYIEYRSTDSNVWSKETPIYPGEYEVRGVSQNGFGSETTSDPIKFNILPKDIELSISESQITYGELPRVSASLFGTDKIESYSVDYDDAFSKKTKVKVNKDSVVILDKNGNDISFCYNVIPQEKELNILPRPITVSFANKEVYFDSKEQSLPDGEITNGTLVANDSITFIENENKHSAIGVYSYSKEVVIKNGDKDVTDMYTVHTNYGSLSIKKIPLTIYSLDYYGDYNGKTLLENDAYRIVCECPGLLNGNKIEYAFEGDYDLYKDEFKPVNTESVFSVKVTDEEGEDVTEYYEISKSYGSINVSKRDIEITFGSNSKLYDGVELSETLYSVSGNLFDGDEVKIEEDLFPKIVEPGYIVNLVENISITNGDGVDVLDCYNVTLNGGELTIKKPHPTFKMLGFDDLTYDAEEHLLDQYELNDDEESQSISSKFEYNLKYEPQICLEAGTYTNNNEILVCLDGVDVTDFFDIDETSYIRSTSEISKREINPRIYFVENNDTEVTYNGYSREVKVDFGEGEMLDSPIYNNIISRDAGVYSWSDLALQIKHDNRDVTESYEVKTVNVININPKTIYVNLPEQNYEYDGESHEWHLDVNQFTGENALCGGDELNEMNWNFGTEEGEYVYSSSFLECSNPENYNFVFDAEEKTNLITKRNITIDFKELSETYNGNEKYLRFDYSPEDLAYGDSIVGSYYDGTSYVSDYLKIINKGTYTKSNFKNFFNSNGSIKIVNSDGADVSRNYNIIDDFDSTLFEIKPFELEVSFIDAVENRIFNGESQIFNEYTLNKELPEGHTLEVVNPFEATRAGEYSNDYKASVNIFDEYGAKVNGNFKLTYKYWDNTTINKKDISITFADFEPIYDGLPFYSTLESSLEDIVTVNDSDGNEIDLYNDTNLSISYKESRDSIFVSNASFSDLISFELINNIYDDAENDYNITQINFGDVDYQKRDVYFKGNAVSFVYSKQTPSSNNLLNLMTPSGDTEFFSRHKIERDQDAVTTTGIYGGRYNLVCDASKFHLKNKNSINANVDNYVIYHFEQTENMVTIASREIVVKQNQHVFNYDGVTKANEKLTVSNIIEGDVVYIVDKDGNKEEVKPDILDYECIIDMKEKNSGCSFECYKDNSGNKKEITDKQFKVFTNISGVLTDITTSYKIVVDKDRVKRGHPIWIK